MYENYEIRFVTFILKLCGNCAFPQNFHTMKLGEITVFYAVATSLTYVKSQRNLEDF